MKNKTWIPILLLLLTTTTIQAQTTTPSTQNTQPQTKSHAIAIRFGPTQFNERNAPNNFPNNNDQRIVQRNQDLTLQLLYTQTKPKKLKGKNPNPPPKGSGPITTNPVTRYKLTYTTSKETLTRDVINNSESSRRAIGMAAGLGTAIQWKAITLTPGADAGISYTLAAKYQIESTNTNSAGQTTRSNYNFTGAPIYGLNISPFLNLRYEIVNRISLGVELQHPLNLEYTNGTQETSIQTFNTNGDLEGDSQNTQKINSTTLTTPQRLNPPLIELTYQW